MTEVRIAAVDPNSFSGNGDEYVNWTGKITGVSGQFVSVRLTYDPMGNECNYRYEKLFLPIELRMR